MSTKTLEVRTKRREKPMEEANIAGPQDYELAYGKLVADGVTSTNIWITLGAVAFNSAEVLAAEIERVRILEHGRQQTAFTSQQKFLKLQSEAKIIYATLKKPKKGATHDFDSLKAGDALVLVRYVYKADGREGISKQSTTKQASVDYLNSLQTDELKKLLEAPPMLKDVPLLTAPIVATEEGTPDDQQPFHVTFGLVTANTGGLVPIAAPEWLEESLNSPSDKRLNGKSILVNWGDVSAPDWLVAKLPTGSLRSSAPKGTMSWKA